MSLGAKLLQMGAAGSLGPATYIDDVFSTYLYSGTDASQTITNGIDLSGKGGMVWIKGRNLPDQHSLYNTVNGAGYYLMSARTDSISYNTNQISSFNSNGYSAGYISSGENYVSWTFRKQAKFFDVVTYTGNGGSQYISHNLGSVPGCIIVKRTDSSSNWVVYHRGIPPGTNKDNSLRLNTTGATFNSSDNWITEPSSTQFGVTATSPTGANDVLNANGGTYVAYLFAHNAGGFGTAGTDNVISCGSWTGNGSASNTVTLGYEPQYILWKNASNGTRNWFVTDNMRGLSYTTTALLNPNTTATENAENLYFKPTATGFEIVDSSDNVNQNGSTFIYIAIRRPMKPPTTGTSVFSPFSSGASVTNGIPFVGTFPPDLHIEGERSASSGKHYWSQRITGINTLASTTTSAQSTDSIYWDNMVGQRYGDTYNFSGRYAYDFKRAPGFFDIVCYTGTGSAITANHNLTVTPELVILKNRDGADNWEVTHKDLPDPNTYDIPLNSNSATFNTGVNYIYNRTSTTVSFSHYLSNNGVKYISYLFATVAGVSKVGSYTGTGSTQQINCGFSGGARFVLIKRTDSTGDWYVWDTARGIVSGNDPYLLLNSTAAETTSTDYIDPYSAGFEISSTAPAAINANGGSYIYLAIA